MIRTDGEYIIYVLQHKFRKKGKWAHSGDAGGFLANIPADDRFAGKAGRRAGSKFPFDEFNACGHVWQQLGIYGTFDASTAASFLQEVAKANPEHSFRIAKVTLSQRTELAAEASYTKGFK